MYEFVKISQVKFTKNTTRMIKFNSNNVFFEVGTESAHCEEDVYLGFWIIYCYFGALAAVVYTSLDCCFTLFYF